MASGYMNGTAATMLHTSLANLFKGNAAITLLPYDASSGVADFSSLDFSSGDQIFTIKDSFQISQADATNTEIKIDQKDETIDTTTEKGEWTISGNIPTIAKGFLDVFFTAAKYASSSTAGAKASGIEGQDGTSYEGYAYDSAPKEVYATMMVENSGQTAAIIFAKVKMSVGVALDDNTNPAYLKLSATILANDADGIGDWMSLTKTA